MREGRHISYNNRFLRTKQVRFSISFTPPPSPSPIPLPLQQHPPLCLAVCWLLRLIVSGMKISSSPVSLARASLAASEVSRETKRRISIRCFACAPHWASSSLGFVAARLTCLQKGRLDLNGFLGARLHVRHRSVSPLALAPLRSLALPYSSLRLFVNLIS